MPRLSASASPKPSTRRSAATSGLSGPSGSLAGPNIKTKIPKATAFRARLDSVGSVLYDLASFLDLKNDVLPFGR